MIADKNSFWEDNEKISRIRRAVEPHKWFTNGFVKPSFSSDFKSYLWWNFRWNHYGIDWFLRGIWVIEASRKYRSRRRTTLKIQHLKNHASWCRSHNISRNSTHFWSHMYTNNYRLSRKFNAKKALIKQAINPPTLLDKRRKSWQLWKFRNNII